MKFVIVGLGSIGSKHKKNLEALGHEVVSCHRGDDLKKILDQNQPDGVLVCTPTALHLTAAMTAAAAGCHLFVEKPLSHNLKGVDRLLNLVKNKHLVLQVGCEMRFHPEIIKLKQNLDQKALGRIYSARIEAGQYLPDWRPGQDYRQSYSAKKSLGGGVILDLCHEIDYAIWFFGQPKKVTAVAKKVADLKIETEALAEILIEFNSGVIAEIHLDYLQRTYRRSCQIIGEKGNLFWEDQPEKYDGNQAYVKEMKNFIASIKGKEKPRAGGEKSKLVLQLIEAVKKAGREGKTVKL